MKNLQGSPQSGRRFLDYVIRDKDTTETSLKEYASSHTIDELMESYFSAIPDLTASRSERHAADVTWTYEHGTKTENRWNWKI
jgi:hypothetical protein